MIYHKMYKNVLNKYTKWNIKS